MFGNINPKQIEGMMKKMGIAQTSLDAKRVIIELQDENIIIDEPSVIKINMSGNESFQISGGAIKTETKEGFSDQDIALVVEKTSVSKEKAIEALKKNKGDIASSILDLTE
jgi:nascent polypeptide-associated complex subunit alpha